MEEEEEYVVVFFSSSPSIRVTRSTLRRKGDKSFEEEEEEEPSSPITQALRFGGGLVRFLSSARSRSRSLNGGEPGNLRITLVLLLLGCDGCNVLTTELSSPRRGAGIEEGNEEEKEKRGVGCCCCGFSVLTLLVMSKTGDDVFLSDVK